MEIFTFAHFRRSRHINNADGKKRNEGRPNFHKRGARYSFVSSVCVAEEKKRKTTRARLQTLLLPPALALQRFLLPAIHFFVGVTEGKEGRKICALFIDEWQKLKVFFLFIKFFCSCRFLKQNMFKN